MISNRAGLDQHHRLEGMVVLAGTGGGFYQLLLNWLAKKTCASELKEIHGLIAQVHSQSR